MQDHNLSYGWIIIFISFLYYDLSYGSIVFKIVHDIILNGRIIIKIVYDIILKQFKYFFSRNNLILDILRFKWFKFKTL